MTNWKLKSCPRCTGDLYIEREKNGWDEACLACGYRKVVSKKGFEQISINAQIEGSRKSAIVL